MKNLFNGKKKRISLIIVIILLLVGLVVVIKYTSLNKDTTTSLTDINDNKESTSPTNENKENNEEVAKAENKDENTSSTEENKGGSSVVENTSTSGKKESNTESTSQKGNSGSSNQGSSDTKPENKPSKPNNGGSTKPSHTHNWVVQTKQVPHKEEGHYENVLVKPAWTEEVPVYEERERSICNGCGKDITADPYKHMKEALSQGNTKCSGYHSEWKKVQVGTKTVKHEAVYKKKWVVDKKAWTETVVTGHKCSGCGQTK